MNDEFYWEREQSQVKHKILQRYLQAFTPIIGRSFDEIVYVDCLAGPWKNKDEVLSDTSFDTALSVFRAFKRDGICKNVRALLIENNPESYARLKAYGRSIKDISVETQEWDFNDHVDDVVRFAKRSRNSFAFFFIDPTGWKEICIDRIRPILRVTPGEVLINFMSSAIRRFLEDPTKPFHELLGKDVSRLRSLGGEEREYELIDTYTAQVRKAGDFAYACSLPVLMPDRDGIHYHLVFGTRDLKGLQEFKRAEQVAIPFMHEIRANAQQRRHEEKTGQPFLLQPRDTYHETRFTNLNSRRRASARVAVSTLLNENPSTTYEEVFRTRCSSRL